MSKTKITKKRVSFELKMEQYTLIKTIASGEGRSFSNMVKKMIKDYLSSQNINDEELYEKFLEEVINKR